ncbi:hypothetical protein RRG08_053879 [Elysia crispata]|uniref:Uncharacterized protein n=1 Tax=Elysia crispata TaxID=231223 RepID=A0AAE0YLL0_9GAST|nr:hypothetical protein RRG08_053879 [Elysia crispata]
MGGLHKRFYLLGGNIHQEVLNNNIHSTHHSTHHSNSGNVACRLAAQLLLPPGFASWRYVLLPSYTEVSRRRKLRETDQSPDHQPQLLTGEIEYQADSHV